jgi:hypothetical protein
MKLYQVLKGLPVGYRPPEPFYLLIRTLMATKSNQTAGVFTNAIGN